jgi:hypothetical protein
LRILFEQSNNWYSAFAKDFLPMNTVDVFGEDIFIAYPADIHPNIHIPLSFGDPPATIIDKMWLPYFYADILRGQDRSMLVDLHPSINISDDAGTPWYVSPLANLAHGRTMFFNSAILLGRETHLAVRNIKKTDFGYQVDSIISTHDVRWGGFALLQSSIFWNTYVRGDAVTLLLSLDGDYLDIYTYGTDIHVGTFIRVGREFQIQYKNLIRTNTADLTNVQWPQRADGSRHFLPPVDLSAFQVTHTTTARLNVRNNPNITAPLVTTLELGTEVQILEIGHTETIGEITAPWVRALSADGFSGWCFSGFLEAIVVESAVVEDQPPFQAPAVVVPQADDVAESGMPLWVWLAIVGATVVVGGIVFAVKRK